MKAFLPLVLLLLGGCVNFVNIHAEDGSVKTKWGLGKLEINMASQELPVVIEIKGAGFVKINNTYALGLFKGTMTFLPRDSCIGIFWINDLKELDIPLLKQSAKECTYIEKEIP